MGRFGAILESLGETSPLYYILVAVFVNMLPIPGASPRGLTSLVGAKFVVFACVSTCRDISAPPPESRGSISGVSGIICTLGGTAFGTIYGTLIFSTAATIGERGNIAKRDFLFGLRMSPLAHARTPQILQGPPSHSSSCDTSSERRAHRARRSTCELLFHRRPAC